MLHFICHHLSAITVPSNIIKVFTFWPFLADELRFTIMEHLCCVIMRFSRALGACEDNGSWWGSGAFMRNRTIYWWLMLNLPPPPTLVSVDVPGLQRLSGPLTSPLGLFCGWKAEPISSPSTSSSSRETLGPRLRHSSLPFIAQAWLRTSHRRLLRLTLGSSVAGNVCCSMKWR